jgi:hypothetical protein
MKTKNNSIKKKQMNIPSGKLLGFSTSLVIALLFVSSCSNNTEVQKPRIFEGYGLWMDTIIKSPQGIIRGIELGNTLAEIKKAEGTAPLEEDTCSLYYELSADSFTFATLTYSFTNSILSEIELSIHSKPGQANTSVFADLKKYLDTKFTAPVSAKGIYVYTTKTAAGKTIKISIEDAAGIEDEQVNLLVYEEQ